MIRRAEIKDIPKILDLLKQVNLVHHYGRPDIFKVGTKYSEIDLKELVLDDNKPIFVCVDDTDDVLGYCFCQFICHEKDAILTDVKTLYIDDLCVDEGKRGLGIGKNLYNYVVEFARQKGCYNLTLNVWSCNLSAIKFYEKVGLVPQKTYLEKIL